MKTSVRIEELGDFLKRKKESYLVKITTRLTGSTKNVFLDDCIRREFSEAEMARFIIGVYYSVIDVYPDLGGKEQSEIKKFIIDRIKL